MDFIKKNNNCNKTNKFKCHQIGFRLEKNGTFMIAPGKNKIKLAKPAYLFDLD